MTKEEMEMMRKEYRDFQNNIFYEVVRQRVIRDVEKMYAEGLGVEEAIQQVLNTWATDIYTMIKEYIEEGEVD